MNVMPLLAEIETRMTAHRRGEASSVINFSLLPMNEVDMTFLQRTLGDGPVRLVSRGYGACRVQATAARNVWSVAARNAIAAARGEKDPSENDVIGLAAERLVGLLRASIMDWPSESLDRGPIAAARRRAIVAARARKADSSVKRKADDIEASLAACGLRADRGAPKGFFANMIEEARSEPLGPPHAPDPLTPVDDAAVIRSLRLGRAAFAARPALPGRRVETGAFARHWRERLWRLCEKAARSGLIIRSRPGASATGKGTLLWRPRAAGCIIGRG